MTDENNGHCCVDCMPRAGTVLVQCDGAIAIYKVFQVGLAPAAQFDRPGVHALSFVLASSNAVHAVRRRVRSTNRARFAGCVSCFISVSINRVDVLVCRSTCGAIMPARSIGSSSTSSSSKQRHMACCCVCMQVNETEHAQCLNM